MVVHGWRRTVEVSEEVGMPLIAWGALLYGAVIASFVCVAAERLQRGETLGGRSHCVCGRQLVWWENVPVVGWLALRGRARCCGSSIPARYVAAEVGLAAAYAAAFTAAPWPLATVIAAASTGLLFAGLRVLAGRDAAPEQRP